MAYNEQCKYTTALVTLNADALKADLAGSSVDMADVINIIKEDLAAFRDHPDYRSIPAQWVPASFAVIAKQFDESNGLVNSTMKLVRHKVRDFYRARIDELYEGGSPDPMCEGNQQAIRELGLLGK